MEDVQFSPNPLATPLRQSSDTEKAAVESPVSPKTCWFCGTTNVFGTHNAVLSNQAKKLLADSKLYIDPVLKSLGVVATETIKDCIQVNTFCRPCLELLSTVWATFDELQRLESVLAALRAECKTAIFSSFYRLGGEDPHHYARGYLLGQLEISEQKFNAVNTREPWGSTDGNAYAEQQRASSSAAAQTSDSHGNFDSMESDRIGANEGEEEMMTELPSAPVFDALSCLIQNTETTGNAESASGTENERVAMNSFGHFQTTSPASDRTVSASWKGGVGQKEARPSYLKKSRLQVTGSRKNSAVMTTESDLNNIRDDLENQPSTLNGIPRSSWRDGDTSLSRPNTFLTIFNCPEKKEEYLMLRRKYERLYHQHKIQEVMVNVSPAYNKDVYCPRLGCNLIFQRKFDMECHVRHHHSEINEPGRHAYLCKVCEFGCGDGYQLKSHMRHHHTPVECDICMTQIEGIIALKSHREQHPENSQRSAQQIVECPSCGKFFKRNVFQAHRAAVHEGDSKAKLKTKKRSYLCRICQRFFYCRLSYNSHMEIHYKPLKSLTNQNIEPGTTQKLPKCTICGKSFKNFNSLYSHKTRYHKKPIQNTRQASVRPLGASKNSSSIVGRCRTCFSVFTDPQLFQQHGCSNDDPPLETSKDSYEVYRQCSRCLKAFYTFSSWYQHRNLEDCLQPVPANLPRVLFKQSLHRPKQYPDYTSVSVTRHITN